MVRVKVLCVGKMKEAFYKDACAEYEKRLRAFCVPEVIELPEEKLPEAPSRAQIDAGLEREADALLGRLPPRSAVVVLTPEGEKCSSAGFAELLSRGETAGGGTLCFVIGSSFGLSPRIKQLAWKRLSMSDMTFPHHLARVMLLEQLYRGFSIRAGGKYDK